MRQSAVFLALPKLISATSEEIVNVSRLDGSKAPRLNMDEKPRIRPPS